MNRGDIYIAHIAPRSGSEQSGTRPVIIVSHNGFNRTPNWNSILVVPLSSSPRQAKRIPTIVALPTTESNTPSSSSILCHQITTLDKKKLGKKIGSLSEEEMKEVEKAMRYALGMY